MRDGCKHPLILWNGILIDGHNRYKICTEHNIPFETEDMEFASRDDAREWVIINQIGRRNIAPGARVEMVRWMKERVAEQAKERQGERTDLNIVPKSAPSEKTRDVLAKLAGVGHDTFTKSEYVLDNGTEEQKTRLRTGDAKPHTLYKEVKLAEAKAKGITSQVCSHCGIEKPLEEFDGGRTRCNACKAQKSVPAPPQPEPQSTSPAPVFRNPTIPPPAPGLDKPRMPISRGEQEEWMKNTNADDIAGVIMDRQALTVAGTIKEFVAMVKEQSTHYTDNMRKLISGNSARFLTSEMPENRQKIIAALSEAEAAITKLKGLLS